MKINQLILVAKITSPHGIKGGANVITTSFKDTILKSGMNVFLAKSDDDSKNSLSYEIEKVTIGNKIIVYIKGINTISHLEQLIPCNIYVSRDLFPAVSNDEFYWIDLIGCQVFDFELQQIIGEVCELYDNGAQSVFVIKDTAGSLIEIPYVKQFVKKIDIENKRIEVIGPKYIE